MIRPGRAQGNALALRDHFLRTFGTAKEVDVYGPSVAKAMKERTPDREDIPNLLVDVEPQETLNVDTLRSNNELGSALRAMAREYGVIVLHSEDNRASSFRSQDELLDDSLDIDDLPVLIIKNR